MFMHSRSTIRLVDGNADVKIGGKTFTVSRRNAGDAQDMCPVELIIAAMGS